MNLRLLKIEFLKLKNYPFFWILTLLIFTSFLIIANSALKTNFPFDNIGKDKIYLFQFPKIWNTFTWFGSWFNHLWAIFFIIFIGEEISNGVFRQENILGLEIKDTFYTRILLILILPLIMVIFISIATLYFGIKYSLPNSYILMFQDIHFIIFYYIQLVSYLTFAFLIVVLFRYSNLSIVFYIGYLIFEAILRFILNQGRIGGIIYFLPMKSFSLMTPKPSIEMMSNSIDKSNFPILFSVIISVMYIIIFNYATLIIMRKRK